MDDLIKELELDLAQASLQAEVKTVLLGADHAGFVLKEQIKNFLTTEGFKVEDQGAFALDETDDYPDIIKMVTRRVASNPEDFVGIIFGGSGQGEAIMANRLPGVRAVVYYGGSSEIVRLSRDHNDANVLSVGARFVTFEELAPLVKLWLTTPFSGAERHLRRLQKIDGKIIEENRF